MTPLALALMPVALAGVTRFAVLVGHNEGANGTRPLLFAEDDARKVHHVLTTVGRVPEPQARLLLSPTRNRFLREMGQLQSDVAEAEARGDDTVVVLYYSGHADADRLQLGTTWVTWDEVRALVDRSGADVRLAFVDACQSGQLTRSKGGTRAPGFDVNLDGPLDATGQVLISSSSRDEASHESDEIGGSYFTHFLVSALAGAGDADQDGRVTVGEAWRFVHRETVFETQASRAGAQHPTYAWDLSGTGEVVLADLASGGAKLVFPTGTAGRYAVFDRDRRRFLAQVDLDGAAAQALALAPGVYLVQERSPSHLLVAEVTLRAGETATVDAGAFAAVEYEDDVAKGTLEKRARQARRPKLSMHAAVGARAFQDDGFAAAYFPDTAVLGAAGRWTWSGGAFVQADALVGSATGALAVTEDFSVPVDVTGATLGVTGGLGTRPRVLTAAAGLRLAGVSLTRTFADPAVGEQQLLTVTPGLVGRVGVNPGPVAIELEVRSHVLPYRIDDYDQGLAFTEALLSFGVRL